jgi:hypothetical protein
MHELSMRQLLCMYVYVYFLVWVLSSYGLPWVAGWPIFMPGVSYSWAQVGWQVPAKELKALAASIRKVEAALRPLRCASSYT